MIREIAGSACCVPYGRTKSGVLRTSCLWVEEYRVCLHTHRATSDHLAPLMRISSNLGSLLYSLPWLYKACSPDSVSIWHLQACKDRSILEETPQVTRQPRCLCVRQTAHFAAGVNHLFLVMLLGHSWSESNLGVCSSEKKLQYRAMWLSRSSSKLDQRHDSQLHPQF